jgi:ELWxxDGT repeat protein
MRQSLSGNGCGRVQADMKTSKLFGLPSLGHVNTLSLQPMKNPPITFRLICLGLLMSMTAFRVSAQQVQLLQDINTASVVTSSEPDNMVLAGNTLFISTDDALSGLELWKFNVPAAFDSAQDVAVDSSGNLYVADTANHVIRKITPSGAVSTFAGTVGSSGSVDASGITAKFSGPRGITVDATGNVYVADSGNHTIRRITSAGVVTTVAGSAGNQGSTDGTGAASLFRTPKDLAVSSDGTQLFVADSGNHVIRRVTLTINGANVVTAVAVITLAGSPLQIGSTDATGAAARFSDPNGTALDSAGNIYVVDTDNHTIRRVTSGGVVTTVAGSAGNAGNVNGTGVAARFSSPRGIANDTTGTNLYIADSGNHQIRRLVIASGAVTTLAGSGTAGSANGTGAAASFNNPRGLAFRNNEIHLADTNNETIRTVTTAGVVTLRAGQVGVGGNQDGAAIATSATLKPELVEDILPGTASSSPQNMTAVGTTLFFSAVDGSGERDLWKSDGTTLGTSRVGNTDYPNDPPGPEDLVALNGSTLLFQGFDAAEGAELWKATVSGSNVTVEKVKNINPSFGESSLIANPFNASGTALFAATDGSDPDSNPLTTNSFGIELWKSNGTLGGTVRVADILNGATGSDPSNFVAFNGLFYFTANGTIFVDNPDPEPDEFVPVGRELFSTNLSTATMVEDIEPVGDSDPLQFAVSGPNTAVAGGQIFFTASTSTEGRELYVMNQSNGMVPTLVRNLNNTAEDSLIEHVTPITVTIGNPARPNRVIFTADANVGEGVELYTSDGTSLETKILKAITPGEDSSVLDNFIPLSSGLVVFTQELTDGTLKLWRTDGTDSGTVEIENFTGETGLGDSLTSKDFRAPVLIGTNLYFMMSNDELWRTNGHGDAGTVMVHRFRTSTGSSDSQGFTQMSDGRVVFSAVTEDDGREPWISDLAGTTNLISDLFAGPTGSDPRDFTPTDDGRVFFTAETSADNRELFVTNGTTATLVQDINPSTTSVPENLFWHAGQDKLYFSATDSGSNTELWVLDGSGAGIGTLSKIEVNAIGGSYPGAPGQFVAYGNHVYFAAETGAGVELWRTDGTSVEASTPFKDIAAGTPSSNPDEFVVMPPSGPTSRLYFIATGIGSGLTASQDTGRELWRTDGTPAGTVVVKDIVVGDQGSMDLGTPSYLTLVGNTLYFVADDGTNGRELWKSDGTPAGTVMVSNINKVNTNFGRNAASDPTELRNVNGKLFFLANDGVNGRELWTSGGTAANTVMVSTGLVTGSGDAAIQNLTVVGDVVTFTADNGVTGREAWISDGTTIGTHILAEFVAGAGSSNPHSLAAAGSRLIFSASDADIGDEPRLVPLSSILVVEQPIDTPLTNGVSVVSFGAPVNFGGSVNVIIRLQNDGINSIRNIVASLGGLHAADYTVTKKPTATTVLAQNGFFDLTIQFKPKEGGTRLATLTIFSTDTDNPQFVIGLTGDCLKNPTVGTHPVSQMVKVGAPVTMTATTSSGTAPITLQWRKNAGPVAGATLNPFYLWAAKLTDAGAYTAQFKSSSTPAGLGTSDVAQLGVVEDYMPARIQPVKLGATIKLTVNAAGNNLTYLWKRSVNANLSSPETLANVGFNTKTLTIPTPQLVDSQFYFCEVSGPGGMAIGGTTALKVFNIAPTVTPAQTLPVGIVGAPYFHQMLVDDDTVKTPTTYSAKNLPGGLKIDAKTGIISGVPTKVETKVVTLGATNGILPAPASVNATLVVINLPSGLDGLFHGLVERDQEINGMTGGRIEITVTKTGAYSGKLTLGATSYSFKGNLSFGIDPDPDNNPMTNDAEAIAPFNGMVRIPRPGIAAPLDLTFTIDETTKDRLSAGLITSVNVGGPVTADVDAWKVTTNTARYLGLHNFGIRLTAGGGDIGDDDVPQGNGYGSFTVSTKGALSIAGMTADGEKITCATHVGPNGEVLLYQSLYATARKGALSGLLTIGLGGDADSPADNVITSGTPFDWTRPPATAVLGTATNTRTYRAGFGLSDTPVVDPVELEAFGGFYQPATHLLQIVNGSTTVDNASLTFTDAGVNLPTREPDLPSLAVNLSAVKVLSASTALTKVVAVLKTGPFSGSFVLADDDVTTTTPAALLNKANEFTRTVKFFGLIVPEAGNHRGVGHFMLPQIPPVATAAKTGQILSGKVNFDN